MARCGCGAGCSCVIQADPDCPSVNVTGAGTAANPYLICTTTGGIGEIIIDFGDEIFVGYSKAFRASNDITLVHLSAHVFALSTSPIVFEVQRNGLFLQEVTLPALTRDIALVMSYDFEEGDFYQIYVSSAGAGGLGLVVQGVFI